MSKFNYKIGLTLVFFIFLLKSFVMNSIYLYNQNSNNFFFFKKNLRQKGGMLNKHFRIL